MSEKKPRWWILIILLGLIIARVAWIWWGDAPDQQAQVTDTGSVLVLGFLAGLLWLIFFSRLSSAARIGTLTGLLGILVGGMLLFRFGGVTGDLVPILEWRWSSTGVAQKIDDASALDVARTWSYPGFQGPDRLAIVEGHPLSRDWKTNPPQLLWRRPMGAGWSGFAVSQGLAVTMEQVGEQERVNAYGLLDGELAWSYGYQARYDNPVGGEGPRSVPTIEGERVYSMGSTGFLTVLDLSSGRLIWEKDVLNESGAENLTWGYSCAPLVYGETVIVTAGGGGSAPSVIAYQKDSGDEAWRGGSTRVGYSSPQVRSLLGRDQLILLQAHTLAGYEAKTGRPLWEYPWSGAQPNVSQPIVVGDDQVFASSGYGVGGTLLKLHMDESAGMKITQLWRSPRLKLKFGNAVEYLGSFYGFDDGVFASIDISTGKRNWKQGRYGHGQVIRTGALLVATTETGEVVLLEANPNEHVELGRFQWISGKTWNPPALAGPFLLIRNHREAAAFRLPTN